MFRTVGQSSHQQNPGVFVEYQESVKKSIQELVEVAVVPNSGNLNIRLKIKDGMDGADPYSLDPYLLHRNIREKVRFATSLQC